MSKEPKSSSSSATSTSTSSNVDDLLASVLKEKTEEEEAKRREEEAIKRGEEERKEEAQLRDSSDIICAVCELGGDLICCDGRCLRSFHPGKIFCSANTSWSATHLHSFVSL